MKKSKEILSMFESWKFTDLPQSTQSVFSKYKLKDFIVKIERDPKSPYFYISLRTPINFNLTKELEQDKEIIDVVHTGTGVIKVKVFDGTELFYV